MLQNVSSSTRFLMCSNGVARSRASANGRLYVEEVMKPKGPAPGTVRVLGEEAMREREQERMLNSPALRGEFNPFSRRWMWGEEEEF
jgi:hypothetical protein